MGTASGAHGLIRGMHVIDATNGVGHDRRVDRPVIIVGYPGVQSLDVAGPFEVFSGANQVLARRPAAPGWRYEVGLVSPGGRPVASESGLTLAAAPLPADVAIDTLVVPGGSGARAASRDRELIEWVAGAAARARRVVTVCTGVFVAAEAGLLEGHRVTTHWARAEQFAAEHPTVEVDPEPIFVRDGRVSSSAGVTAGIDLSLALVEDDLGVDVAQTVARWLVMFLRRPGGQSQFAAPVWMPRAERSSVRAAQAAIESSPADDHCVATLARRASMSPRHFTRVFTAEVGEPPGRYVERIRTDAARRELEATTDPVTAVAARCGFGSAESLRRSFVKRVGVSPDQYRSRFAARHAGGGTA